MQSLFFVLSWMSITITFTRAELELQDSVFFSQRLQKLGIFDDSITWYITLLIALRYNIVQKILVWIDTVP